MAQEASRRGLIPVGTKTSFSKTISETDIYLFAGISGDLGPNHVNAEYMKATRYGKIIAHGVLIMGLMSTCSTAMIATASPNRPAVSYGYDRVRFVKPVFVGDTVTVTYAISEEDTQQERTLASVTATNQHGEVVAVATHILQFI